MIIDNESKQLLDLLISATPDMERKSFSYERICEVSGLTPDEMFLRVKHLVKLGLAEYVYLTTRSMHRDIGIALTQAGQKYREIGKLEQRERNKAWLFGFISGLLTSVLAGLIIEWITG